MLNIEDKDYKPSIKELSAYVQNPLFDELLKHMEQEYKANSLVEYSGDKVLLGWNLKFKKAGRTLCTVYPRVGHFPLLLIVGRKEKDRVEALLPAFSQDFQKVYIETKEGMGQRWLLFNFSEHTETFEDVMKVVQLRRESK